MYEFRKVRVAILVDKLLTELFGVNVTKNNFQSISKTCENKWAKYRYFKRIFRSTPLIIVDNKTHELIYYNAYDSFDDVSGHVLVKWNDVSDLFKNELDETRLSTKHLLDKVLNRLNANYTKPNSPLTSWTAGLLTRPTLLNRGHRTPVTVVLRHAQARSHWVTHKNVYIIEVQLDEPLIRSKLRDFMAQNTAHASTSRQRLNNERFDVIVKTVLFMHNSNNREWLVETYRSNDQSLNAKRFPAYDILSMLIRNNALPTQKQRESINNRIFYKRFGLAPYTELIAQINK